ncbi:alpha/beta hydrolase family protein [Acidicapsa ligni]|uniref:alpha/beta hydrolase family protein n=1 Tax=Acidicapsa ligni TaxID=542300 RepID=UPI0021DF5D81|nr:alpha/beta hydrolase [Acidicapsa ligni]
MIRRLFFLFAIDLLTMANLHAQTPNIPIPMQAAPEKEASPATGLKTLNIPDDAPKEDWNTLALAKSNLPPQSIGGFLLSKVDLPGGCTREILRMEWRKNDPIDLYVIRPTHNGKMPVVLFLYNYTFDNDIFREDRWCDRARDNGFAAVAFATALSWPRIHSPRPIGNWFVSQLQEALASSTHDVQMVLNYLETRNDLDAGHVAVFGQGSGGAVAILSAAADQRIASLDLLDPWGDWPEFLRDSKQIPEDERPNYLKPEFLKSVASLDPVDYLPELKDRVVRMQQISDEPVMPAAAKEKMASAAPHSDQLMRFPDRAAAGKALGSNGIMSWLGEQANHETSGSRSH